jgi:hypothetical protein
MTEVERMQKVEGQRRNRKVAVGLFAIMGVLMLGVILLGGVQTAAAYDPAGVAPLPTPDVSLVEDAFVDSGFTFNAIWPYAAIAIAVLAPFALFVIGIKYGRKLVGAVKKA